MSGCEYIFVGSLSGCQNRVFEKKWALFVFVFLCWRKKKRKYEKHGKRKFQKKTEKLCFWVAVNKEDVFLQKWHFLKNRQTLFVFGRKKTAHFRCNYSKSPNTTEIGASAGTRENPKWHFWLQKCHFGKGPRKGVYYLWYLKAVLCWKHYFIVFSAKHSFADIKECNLKNKNLSKIGGCLPTCRKVFICLFVCCLVVLFFFVCFIFCLENKTPKGYFPAILEYFSYLCP